MTRDAYEHWEPVPASGHWTDEEINNYYDSHLNITLRELSALTGYSVQKLKKILMGEQ